MKPARMSCTRNSIEPLRIDPPGSVLYKDRIKVSRHRFLNFPLYDATTKRVRTPNLKNLWRTAEHRGDKLVTGKQKTRPAWIVSPHLTARQPHLLPSFVSEQELALFFFRFACRS
jgi:hypothetical protein